MLSDVKQIKQMIHDMLRDVHTCIPGKITSYDASKGTAKIQPSGKYKLANGEYLDYPELNNVPVISLQSADQKATIAFPIKGGDGCFIFFAEQQLDSWRNNSVPNTDLRHGLSNAVAVVGLFNSSNETIKDACDDDAVIIDRDKSRIVVKKETVIVYPNKDDTTHKVEVTKDSVNANCGKFTEFSMTDTSVGMKCGPMTSIDLSPTGIDIKSLVVSINGIAVGVVGSFYATPLGPTMPPVTDIPGYSEALDSIEEAMK